MTAVPCLTPRHEEVTALVAEGLLDKQIAFRLGCSERTVKAHVLAARRRVRVRTRTALALWHIARASDAERARLFALVPA